MKSILWFPLNLVLMAALLNFTNAQSTTAKLTISKSTRETFFQHASTPMVQDNAYASRPTRDTEVYLSVTAAEANQLTISMNNSEPVYGFQFNIVTIPEVEFTPGSFLEGGSADDAVFTQLINADGLILGYSVGGSVIPPGQSILTSLTWSVSTPPDSVTLANAIFADGAGNPLEVEIGPPAPYSQYELYNLAIGPTGIFQLLIFLETISELEPGDEIGIFDAQGITNSGDCSNQLDELLVGAGIWDGSQLEISAIGSIDNCSLGGYQLPGFVEGQPVYYRLWRPATMTEYVLLPEYSAGSGVFGDLFIAISAVQLTESTVYGCTDASACNYDPEALQNWGCIYSGLWYADEDGDGYGSGDGAEFCPDDIPQGWVSNNLDPEPDCWNPMPNILMLDDCGVCAGNNQDMDCSGICFGTAVTDDCGECVLGTTGLEFDWAMDCEGVCFGSAVLDELGICCQAAELDCSGICFGQAEMDSEGNCCNAVEIDCANICYGTALIDNCSECVQGSTGLEFNWAMDCEGVCFGSAVLDELGNCCQTAELDCAGICFGSSYVDNCDVCDDDPSNDDLTCENCAQQGLNEDCDGYCFGDEYLTWQGDGYCDAGAYGVDLMCQQWNFDSGDCAGSPLTFLDVSVQSENGWFDIGDLVLSNQIGESLTVQLGPAYIVGNGGGTAPPVHENHETWDAYMAITDYSGGIVEVSLNSSQDIGGFQFTLLSGFVGFTLDGASGGSAGAAGFMVSTNSEGLVLGFSFTGSFIEGGEDCASQGFYADCTGICFAEEDLILLGDGQCNNGLDENPDLNCSKWLFDGGDCSEVIYGCTDAAACNYDPEANLDDGSCSYPVNYWDDLDGDGYGDDYLGSYCPGDEPGNSLLEGDDNCPDLYNPDQADEDGNGIGDLCQEGCTAEDALNYDPYAAIDDGSCLFEDAPLDLLAQDNFDGTINLSWAPPGSGSRVDVYLWISAVNDSLIEISMSNTEDIYGFQFSISADSSLNATLGQAWGGRAEEAGFTLSTNESGFILGFSFTGGYIPVGEGVLLYMDWSSSGSAGYICIDDNPQFSIYEFFGPVEVGDCYWYSPEAPADLVYSVYRDGELIASGTSETNYTDTPPVLYETYCYYVTALSDGVESNPSVTVCSFSHLDCSTDPIALNYCPDATYDDGISIYFTALAPAESEIISITDETLMTDSLTFLWSASASGSGEIIDYELRLSLPGSGRVLTFSTGALQNYLISYFDLVEGLWLYPETMPVVNWQVQLIFDNFQISSPQNNFTVDQSELDVTAPSLPSEFTLLPNYPNPFNPVTTIEYILPERTAVQLDIYDLQGRLIANLLLAGTPQPAGHHKLQWDAGSEPSGIYLVRSQSDRIVLQRKILLLK